MTSEHEPAERLIGLSISNSPDLARLGYGAEHLHETMLNVARALLRLPAQMPERARVVSLAYGGDLRPGGFTRALFELARAEAQESWTGRLYSFMAWPHYLSLDKAEEAQLINTCRFVRVTPADAGIEGVDAMLPPQRLQDIPPEYLAARCLSEMRRLMTVGGAAIVSDV
ncbi:MAG: hypothetical protein KDK91_05470, partial [Gammaproteobacteria bacterium]|nr:hypothetical protein [Gammaproteobacteria bacterium]